MRTRILTAGCAALFVLAMPSRAHAAHHLWRIHQLFSNTDGSIQFIELETATGGSTGETALGGLTLTAGTNGANSVTFTPLSPTGGPNGPTNWLLIGTANVAAVRGGVAPDFIIQPNFFSTSGGTINYASGTDTWTYGPVPTDGIHGLTRDPNTLVISTAPNAPTNLAGTASELNLVPAPSSAPALPAWGIAVGLGVLLLAGSGLLQQRRRPAT